jgi:signal peptidase I
MNLGKLTVNLVTIFFIILLFMAAVVILAPFAGWRIDTVMSGSMEPAIPVGGMVILGPVSASQIHAGDIIAYDNGQVEVCHRVITVLEGQPASYITKGDANRSPDGTQVTPGMVTGKLIVAIPLAGYITYFIKTPPGLFLTVLLPILFLIGSEFKKLIIDEKEDDKSRDPE